MRKHGKIVPWKSSQPLIRWYVDRNQNYTIFVNSPEHFGSASCHSQMPIRQYIYTIHEARRLTFLETTLCTISIWWISMWRGVNIYQGLSDCVFYIGRSKLDLPQKEHFFTILISWFEFDLRAWGLGNMLRL